MKTLLTLAVAALAIGAAPASAQTVAIDPGMTREEVEALLGKPVGVRSSGTHVYLFYRNGCEVRCGMQDLVILENDAVVDAIFRAPNRTFSGASSSPTGVKAEATVGDRAAGAAGARRGGIIVAPAISDAQPASQPAGSRAVATPATSVPVAPAPGGPATGNPAAATRPTSGPGGVPLNPSDTITTRPAPANPSALMPATPQSQPVPNAGARPSPSDSARAARGIRPDTTRKP